MSDQRQKILVTGWRKYVFTADGFVADTLQGWQVFLYQDGIPESPSQGRPVHRDHTETGEGQLRVCLLAPDIELTGSTIVPLQIWDTPSNFELDQLDTPLASFSTIVYVMDMQVRGRFRG